MTKASNNIPIIRIGFGYDVHKFAENRKLILGGVEIPYEKGLMGHSDADVLLHAISDAILGALALGDIGQHFPDTDKRYKDADSAVLLKKVYEMIADKGYKINNIDATVFCEKPKLKDFIIPMRKNICDILNTSIDNISVKATTEEGLGLAGKGIGTHAVVLISKA